MIEVYHGGTEPIANPLVSAGREGLDFGKGFYVTCILNQQAIDKYLHFKEAIQC